MEKSILNFLMLNKKQIFGPKFVYNMNPIDIKKNLAKINGLLIGKQIYVVKC